MIPLTIQADTERMIVSQEPGDVQTTKAAVSSLGRPADRLRPELRAIFEANWKRDEPAYRYLAR